MTERFKRFRKNENKGTGLSTNARPIPERGMFSYGIATVATAGNICSRSYKVRLGV